MKIYEKIVKAHNMKMDAASSIIDCPVATICIQDHYDVPSISLSYLDTPSSNLVLFNISGSGDLDVAYSENFTGDIDAAKKLVMDSIK